MQAGNRSAVLVTVLLALVAGCTGRMPGPAQDPIPMTTTETTAPVPDAVGPHAWVPFATSTKDQENVTFADGRSAVLPAGASVQGAMAIHTDRGARDDVIVATEDGVAELSIDAVSWIGEDDALWREIDVDGRVVTPGGQHRTLHGAQYAWVSYSASGAVMWAQIQDQDGTGWTLAGGDQVTVRGPVEGMREPSIRTGWLSGGSTVTATVTARSLTGATRRIEAQTEVGHLVAMDALPTAEVPVVVEAELWLVPRAAVAHARPEAPGTSRVRLAPDALGVSPGGVVAAVAGEYPAHLLQRPDGSPLAAVVALADAGFGGWAVYPASEIEGHTGPQDPPAPGGCAPVTTTRHVTTSPSPGGPEVGFGISAGRTLTCLAVEGCWVRVVPPPGPDGIPPQPEEHWIPADAVGLPCATTT